MCSRQNRALRELSEVTGRKSSRLDHYQAYEARHGRTLHRFTHDLVRAGRHSGEAVHRDPVRERDLLQPAAQGLRLAPEAAVRLPARTARSSSATTWSRATSSPRTSTCSSRRRRSRRSKRSARTRSRSPSSCRSSPSIRCTSTRRTTSSPDKGAAKPYGLLNEALKEAKLCAVGRWATRGKAYIVLLRPIGDVLTMQQLHFAADVRPCDRSRSRRRPT